MNLRILGSVLVYTQTGWLLVTSAGFGGLLR